MRKLTLFITALVLFVGCRRQRLDFFPLVPGAVRIMKVYEHKIAGRDTTAQTEVRVTEVVMGVKDVPQLGKVWVVEAPLDSGKKTVYFYDRRGDTIFKIVPGRGGKPERILYLRLPLRVGDRWYESETERELTEVVAIDSVDVPAGKFQNCYKLETKSNKVDFQRTLWLLPGLGAVKREKIQRWRRGDTMFELFQREELVEYQVIKKKRP
ncbi:MAG: hypothetical protein K6T77_04010 [candidate division WOR-3 bacterium]|jgi:hypothetical protein|nr:hypothetical protein [candidate division WOR-3 bacterium]MCR4423102.1 hypothetical protein [candidate division WOR-3 bacterium]MDH7518441.1 hypothetical protein [bacterium]